ncbi:hypothetical protein EYC80_009632 [Monilinia laxa]|uniref:Uncharacterized protein n=1 Tax=Monilinia laxa TaxID=61186 RepID=A0A5N6JYN1_MONLA|nr:hypothetical protein EYC80_009632 [Monilinia laxa]
MRDMIGSQLQLQLQLKNSSVFIILAFSCLIPIYYITPPFIISRHSISPDLTSPHIALYTHHLTSPHLTSPHLTSPHLTSHHITYITSPHPTSLGITYISSHTPTYHSLRTTNRTRYLGYQGVYRLRSILTIAIRYCKQSKIEKNPRLPIHLEIAFINLAYPHK